MSLELRFGSNLLNFSRITDFNWLPFGYTKLAANFAIFEGPADILDKNYLASVATHLWQFLHL